jgi:hypothetical protein
MQKLSSGLEHELNEISGLDQPLRHDLNRSKLVEVMIKGKRYFDTELFHDDFARAVSETPTLIIELLKCLPRKCQINGSDLVYFRKIMIKEPRA